MIYADVATKGTPSKPMTRQHKASLAGELADIYEMLAALVGTLGFSDEQVGGSPLNVDTLETGS
ncbi:hypothetical protein ACIBHY_47345 [Nonomuraea sp. NPDC050547]|uniref:hypothetical protein n=1 Tax=Nonomuraea sp. NPDC050547 TaxID=3364368 RepID=UPI0037A43B0C